MSQSGPVPMDIRNIKQHTRVFQSAFHRCKKESCRTYIWARKLHCESLYCGIMESVGCARCWVWYALCRFSCCLCCLWRLVYFIWFSTGKFYRNWSNSFRDYIFFTIMLPKVSRNNVAKFWDSGFVVIFRCIAEWVWSLETSLIPIVKCDLRISESVGGLCFMCPILSSFCDWVCGWYRIIYLVWLDTIGLQCSKLSQWFTPIVSTTNLMLEKIHPRINLNFLFIWFSEKLLVKNLASDEREIFCSTSRDHETSAQGTCSVIYYSFCITLPTAYCFWFEFRQDCCFCLLFLQYWQE